MRFTATRFTCSLFFVCLLAEGLGLAQNWTMWQGPNAGVRIRARLRDQPENAQKHIVAIEVEVQNVWLHYPNPVSQAGVEVGVLQYQLDRCPPVLTTDTRLRFDQLTSGEHTVSLTLLAEDNRPLSPTIRLDVSIPAGP